MKEVLQIIGVSTLGFCFGYFIITPAIIYWFF